MFVPYAAECIGEWAGGLDCADLFQCSFDRVNNQGILNKLCSVGIGDSVLSMLTQCQSNQSHHVMVDGCRSKLVNVVSEVPPGSVLVPSLFFLYTSQLFFYSGKQGDQLC